MNYLNLALGGAWKVLAAGLVLGAGLPLIFGIGLRALSMGATTTGDGTNAKATAMGKVLFAICLAVVFIGIALGLLFIIASGFGKQLTFDGIIPVLVSKK